MTEQELRELVRDAVIRAKAGTEGTRVRGYAGTLGTAGASGTHPSHAQYFTLINVGDACLIEPSVECTHCGYCKSHGH